MPNAASSEPPAPPPPISSGAPIDCGASFLQGVFPGKIHSREVFVPVMKGDGSFGVLYKCVIALPIPVGLLMKLHFDLYAFVDGLNHSRLLRCAAAAASPA